MKPKYSLKRLTLAQKLANEHFQKWWTSEGFRGPTFMDCFEKGVEIGYKLGRKPK